MLNIKIRSQFASLLLRFCSRCFNQIRKAILEFADVLEQSGFLPGEREFLDEKSTLGRVFLQRIHRYQRRPGTTLCTLAILSVPKRKDILLGLNFDVDAKIILPF